MFAELIDECRGNLSRAQPGFWGRLFGGARRSAYLDRTDFAAPPIPEAYKLLFERGTVVWATCAQANVGLFSPGRQDLPANTIYSPERYFDRHPHHVVEIAAAVFRLKDTKPVDRKLAIVADTISDEMNNVDRMPLPRTLTAGHKVYFALTVMHRSRLPDGILSQRLFPLVICPAETRLNMVLPLRLWARRLRDEWAECDEQLSALAASTPALLGDGVSQ